MKLGTPLPPLFPDVLAASMDVASISCHLVPIPSHFDDFATCTSPSWFVCYPPTFRAGNPCRPRDPPDPARAERQITTFLGELGPLFGPRVDLPFRRRELCILAACVWCYLVSFVECMFGLDVQICLVTNCTDLLTAVNTSESGLLCQTFL